MKTVLVERTVLSKTKVVLGNKLGEIFVRKTSLVRFEIDPTSYCVLKCIYESAS